MALGNWLQVAWGDWWGNVLQSIVSLILLASLKCVWLDDFNFFCVNRLLRRKRTRGVCAVTSLCSCLAGHRGPHWSVQDAGRHQGSVQSHTQTLACHTQHWYKGNGRDCTCCWHSNELGKGRVHCAYWRYVSAQQIFSEHHGSNTCDDGCIHEQPTGDGNSSSLSDWSDRIHRRDQVMCMYKTFSQGALLLVKFEIKPREAS